MATRKRGLGKGLSALLPSESTTSLLAESLDQASITEIKIDSIVPNKSQPRKQFEEESLEELKESIEEFGVIQPIIVRKTRSSYEIIAGERRWRAAKAAGLKTIPCIVRTSDDREAMKLALIENIQREDLNPIEEALAYKSLLDEYSLTQNDLAKTLGKSRSYIANTIRLLNLDKETIDKIKKGELTASHGRALLAIKDKDKRLAAASGIINGSLNVRDVEGLAKEKKKQVFKPSTSTKRKDPFIIDIEERLMRYLGTKVNVTLKKDGGKIEIEFYNNDDLERILETLS